MSDLDPHDVPMEHGPRIPRLVSVDKASGSAILGKGTRAPLLMPTQFSQGKG